MKWFELTQVNQCWPEPKNNVRHVILKPVWSGQYTDAIISMETGSTCYFIGLGLVVGASSSRSKKISYGTQDQFLSPRARTPRILRKVVADASYILIPRK